MAQTSLDRGNANKTGYPVGYVDLSRVGFSKVGTKTETRFVPAHPVNTDLLKKLPRPEEKRLLFLDDIHVGKDRPYLYYRRP